MGLAPRGLSVLSHQAVVQIDGLLQGQPSLGVVTLSVCQLSAEHRRPHFEARAYLASALRREIYRQARAAGTSRRGPRSYYRDAG
jgi:hypothetical protein